MFGIRTIQAYLRSLRAVRFVMKRSDMISNITRDRDYESAAGEAIKEYFNESFKLLPRRYELILSALRDEQLLSKEQFEAYLEDAHLLVTGCDGYVEYDAQTGTRQFVSIKNRSFPWEDYPDLLSRCSERMRHKIDAFNKDLAESRADEKGFYAALGSLSGSWKSDD